MVTTQNDMLSEKVSHIVRRVQQSALSNDVKASLYATMQDGIRSVVMTSLVTRMPKDKLDALVADSEKSTPDALITLMEEAVGDGEVLRQAQTQIFAALDSIEAALTKQKIP